MPRIASSKNKKGNHGFCRAFRQRTMQYLHRAVASWQAMFLRKIEVPGWEPRSCAELARLVKAFLGQDVSDVPEEQLAFQSIKKGLPSSCECMENDMLDKLVSSLGGSPTAVPSGYLSFVKREVSRLFHKGWDSAYESHCLTVTPPLSSVFVEQRIRDPRVPYCPSAGSRSTGGCLGQAAYQQDDFLNQVLHGEGELEDLKGKLMVVQSAGKPRPLSKFEASALALKPLHKTIYGFLKTKKWLLVGDPTQEKLSRAGFREGGGSLVSGDYAAATDGLSIEVAEVILDVLLSSGSSIPDNVKRGALRALRPLLLWGEPGLESHVRATVGQMMGSYLSFPLLCLQNYLAFKWSLRNSGLKKVPVLINGDDILFQAPSSHYDKWERDIAPMGLRVERTKTSVEDSWGTINSTLLRWVDGRLKPVWSARLGMFRYTEQPQTLGRSFSSFLRGCDDPALRFRCGREFFKWHLGELRSSGVSPVSLGFRGLLARRLSKIFDLLELPLSELPRPFDKHNVGYDVDFIDHVDISALGPEELFQSSLELGAEKWGGGWKPVDLDREAVRYCISRTLAKKRVDRTAPACFDWGSCPLSEFRFRLRSYVPEKRVKVSSKAFLAPFPARTEVLVSTKVLSELSLEPGQFDPPPSYRESVATAA